MGKISQNQDILHFVFHCVRMMSGYFRNFNPPSPRSKPFSYPINIVTFVVCWGVSFITRNVRILAYFLSGFCQDCQDIRYPFGSGYPENIDMSGK